MFKYHWESLDTDVLLVADSVVGGLCAGGIRIAPNVSEEDLGRLARLMTLKFAIARIPLGGAKSAVVMRHGADRELALKKAAHALEPFLSSKYLLGEDSGSSPADVVAIYQTLGIDPIAFVAGKARERGLTLEVPPGLAIEHLMNDQFASALSGTGVVHALDRAVAATGDSLAGKRASVQGFGSVGYAAVDALVKHGVAVVAVSDVHGTVYHPDGLDPAFLAHSGNRRTGEIDWDQLPAACRLLPGDEWLAVPCDVLVPAAIADSITLVNVSAVHPEVQFVAEGANGPISVDAEQVLEDGGVTVLPDFVANAGSAVAFGLLVTGESTLDTVSEDYLNRIAVAVDRCTDRSGTGERYTRGRAMAMAEEYLTALSDDNSY